MSRLRVEVPSGIPGGVFVEFFADQACSVPAAMSVTETSRSPGLSITMPRSTLPALFAPEGVRQVFARWSQPAQQLTGPDAGEVTEATYVRRCRPVPQMVVSGSW